MPSPNSTSLCNIKGNAEKDCWGQCIHCKKFGHQSKFCKYCKIKNDEEIEAAKRAREDKQKEKKDKNKKKKRDKAKRARELSNVDSPLESDEESSDDNNSGSPRVFRITDRQVPTTSRAAKRAMEYIDSCSDLEVKKALDQTNFASKVKKR